MNINEFSDNFVQLITKPIGIRKAVYPEGYDEKLLGQALWWEGATSLRDSGLTDSQQMFWAGLRLLSGFTLLLSRMPSADTWKTAIASVRRLRLAVDEAKKFFHEMPTGILHRELLTQLTLSGAFGDGRSDLSAENRRLAKETSYALVGTFLVSVALDHAVASKIYRTGGEDVVANIGVAIREIL